MGKITKIELSESERIKLNFGFKEGASHCFRMRCKAVLLKSEGLSSEAIGKIVEMTQISVNNWVKRYLLEGISGLETRKGRGR
ncbi:MAG: helix-turn-helix domain-containing protein, partial [Bacteroidales bacterium]|nr:helix-turn-helix domain-containing protein [Bacteroidales bacterium]